MNNNIEYRDYSFKAQEVREVTDENTEAKTIVGYASVFDSPSEQMSLAGGGQFVEYIKRGAFKRSLEQAAAGEINIFAVWSHDMTQPLGSTRSGKLKLEEDDYGLRFELIATRMTPAQFDTILDGDAQVSFGFSVVNEDWQRIDADNYTRTISDVNLIEISPVLIPAYPDTSVAVRSLNSFKQADFNGAVTKKKMELDLRIRMSKQR